MRFRFNICRHQLKRGLLKASKPVSVAKRDEEEYKGVDNNNKDKTKDITW